MNKKRTLKLRAEVKFALQLLAITGLALLTAYFIKSA